jgi:hypothetical protein
MKNDQHLEALQLRFPSLRWTAGSGTNVYHGHAPSRWITVERDVGKARLWCVSTAEKQMFVRADSPVEAVARS